MSVQRGFVVDARLTNRIFAGFLHRFAARMRRTEVRPIFRRRAIAALVNARTVELPDLVGVEGCRYRAAQALTVLAGLRQAGAYPFPENLPFELGEDR